MCYVNAYFLLKFPLTLLEVMMKLNHKILKNVDIEMIDQCENKQFRKS